MYLVNDAVKRAQVAVDRAQIEEARAKAKMLQAIEHYSLKSQQVALAAERLDRITNTEPKS